MKPIAGGMRLRPAAPSDRAGLHALFCVPEVYRYLADGAPPPPEVAEEWTAPPGDAPGEPAARLWVLTDANGELAGCVRIAPADAEGAGELTYVLHPRHWGQGLAARMAWTAVQWVFARGDYLRIRAGADEPNHASIAVMRRLGMRFARRVQYPAGPGVEYLLERGDPPPKPPIAPLPLDE